MFIDSHAHIEGADFDSDREAMIARARNAGVEIIVAVGNGEIESCSREKAFRIAERHPFIYTTVGVHPHEARLLDENIYAKLAEWSRHPKVIAWGEIGLDYYYDNSPRDSQLEAFRRQLRMARERGLPPVLHTRDAEKETLAILEDEWKGAGLPGIVHCFTGTREFAERAVELGFLISFSGIVTFKKSDDLREIARALPIDKILIETDCPLLTPVPYRGRRNEPAYVVEVARCIAGLRSLTIEEIGQATSENFKRLFNLDGARDGSES